MPFSDDARDRYEIADEAEITVTIRGDLAALLRTLAARLGGPIDAVASAAVVALAERMGVDVDVQSTSIKN